MDINLIDTESGRIAHPDSQQSHSALLSIQLCADTDVVLCPEVTVGADIRLFNVTLLDPVLLDERAAAVAGLYEMPLFAFADGARLRGRRRRWKHVRWRGRDGAAIVDVDAVGIAGINTGAVILDGGILYTITKSARARCKSARTA